uniref:Germin-like protein n=1 Tax=Chenopodium quinoa TaxID=63459 RepID=A0A803M082_CHEQI
MAGVTTVMLAVLLANTIGAFANDPDMLQDVCVADPTSEDFFFTGISKPSQIANNILGSKVTGANVMDIPGLNTLGVSMARVDFAPYGLNPPHIHPRATEMIYILQGELYVGFITTNNKLVSKIVKAGEVFVFPRGLAHFQKNTSKYPTAVVAAFNSQLPGTQQFAAVLFTSKDPVPKDVLAQAFNIDEHEVEMIRAGLTQ